MNSDQACGGAQDCPVEKDLNHVHARLNAFSEELANNTRATTANADSIARVEGSVQTIAANTNEIVSFFQAGRGAFKVLGWLGTIAKWITYVGGAIGALYAIKNGIPPPKV